MQEAVLAEKDYDCFRMIHDDTSLRFPHIFLLSRAIEQGHMQRTDLAVDSQGSIRIDLHPEKLLNPEHRQETMKALHDAKANFVRLFLQDKHHFIADALHEGAQVKDGVAKRIIAEGRASGGKSTMPRL